ncbi:MAG: hypothetical protein FWG34_10095 [Oscillospiraceae bacterium]|nr:hypothetical protein [Oscillospiraceae bacterium]
MISGCPGAAAFKGAQELKIKICPECGGEIEIFSRDSHAKCKCGFVAYNDSQSCIAWCAYARKCVGDEIYDDFIKNQKPPRP